MSISSVSGVAAASLAQQTRDQVQAAQGSTAAQIAPVQEAPRHHRHHGGGGTPSPRALGMTPSAAPAANGTIGINTLA